MGDISNDAKCQRAGCGHLGSAHADTADGDNAGACSMQGCDCSAMTTSSGAATSISVEALAEALAPGDAAFAADLAAAITRSGHGTTEPAPVLELSEDQEERALELRVIESLGASRFATPEFTEALKKMSAAYCFRTGCSHLSSEHLDLEREDLAGAGKCTVNGCMCASFQPQGAPGEPRLPEPAVTAAADDGILDLPDDTETETPGDGYPFRALLVQEGVETSDGRFIEPMATKWRTPPLSLQYQGKSEHGGFGDTAAINIGRIDAIERLPGDVPGTFDIWGTGVIDDDDEEAIKAAHKIEGQFLRGVSVDMAVHAAEEQITAVDEDGWPIGSLLIVTDCEIGMATVTPFAAFGDCQITLTGPGPSEAEDEIGFELPELGDRIPILAVGETVESFTYHFVQPVHVEEREEMTVLASGGPMTPPREWFDQPSFHDDELVEIPPHLCSGHRNVRACPLTITDDGRVYGHLASWHVNHTAMSGRSIRAPKNAGYELFNSRGVLRTADGEDLPVGTITLDGGHADLRLDWRAAIAHYDDTRSAVIDCRVGADEHGVWLAGALRPDVDELTLRRLRAASISGDWRPFGGRHELVAACSVNTPGFPTMRALAASGADEIVALVAAGALPTRPEPTAERLLAQATAELATIRREREAERLLRTIG